MTENKTPTENTETEKTVEELTAETQQPESNDPFARLQKEKKRVARPQAMHIQ